MNRLKLVETGTQDEKVKALFGGIQANLGRVPNMMRAMANSPVVLEIYLSVNAILARGTLTGELRELLAIVVAEANQCEYCLSAHTAKGKKMGLDAQSLGHAQQGRAKDPKTEAALLFARSIIEKRGALSDSDVNHVRSAGHSDGEIAEIIAVVTFNVFPNYFNKIAETDLDFPKTELTR